MVVEAAALEKAATAGDLTATALADALVREHGLPFRAAHEAVAALVSSDVDRTQPAAAAACLSRTLGREITPAVVAAALDPRASVEAAAFGGGPAAVSLAAQHDALAAALSDQRERAGRIIARDEAARQKLRAEINRILAEHE
jgi:argininosuccinate lyase